MLQAAIDVLIIEHRDGTTSLYSHLALFATSVPSDNPVGAMIDMGISGDPNANIEVLRLVPG